MDEKRNRSSLVLGAILIAAGTLFLLGRVFGLSDWGSLWPLIVILIGGFFFAGMLIGGKAASALAIPGSIVVMTGLILLVQNWFDLYETWAYAWGLIITAVGIGIAIFGMVTGADEQRRSGWRLARLGLTLFILFGAFFEFIFRLNGFSAGGGRLFWPAALILLGLWMLVARLFKLVSKKSGLSWEDRDLFWPVLMAGSGAIWLLILLGWLPAGNVTGLLGLWPLLLIGGGLDLIFGRRFPLFGALLGVIFVGVVAWFAFNATRFDLNPRWNWSSGGVTEVEMKGSGVIVSEAREVSGFDSIGISDSGMAEVIQGETEGLTIEADDNLLPYIESRVSGDRLEIGFRRGYLLLPSKPVRFTIHVRDLSEISVSGSSDVKMAGLATDKLQLSASGLGSFDLSGLTAERLEVGISGTGSMELAGLVEQVELRISGAGNVNAGELETRRTDVRISGAGRAILWVIDELSAHISGAGFVTYYGSPVVSREISGIGTVDKSGEKPPANP